MLFVWATTSHRRDFIFKRQWSCLRRPSSYFSVHSINRTNVPIILLIALSHSKCLQKGTQVKREGFLQTIQTGLLFANTDMFSRVQSNSKVLLFVLLELQSPLTPKLWIGRQKRDIWKLLVDDREDGVLARYRPIILSSLFGNMVIRRGALTGPPPFRVFTDPVGLTRPNLPRDRNWIQMRSTHEAVSNSRRAVKICIRSARNYIGVYILMGLWLGLFGENDHQSEIFMTQITIGTLLTT